MEYYNMVKNWHKIKPHLTNERLNKVLVRDFNKFTMGRWNEGFKTGMFPSDFESCDWQLRRIGRPPAYWNYVKHGACHWLVNFNYILATLVEPNIDWRILTSIDHSTVWNRDEILFDMNFLALRVHPLICFQMANEKMLGRGRLLNVGNEVISW